MKIKETLSTAVNSVRYSLAFCWRNAPGLTVLDISGRLLLTGCNYLMVVLTGVIVSKLQVHLTGPQSSGFSIQQFIAGDYFMPVVYLVSLFYVRIGIAKARAIYASRRRQILHFANLREIQNLRETLDIATIESKKFDDLERKINELPDDFHIRKVFAEEVMILTTEVFGFVIFGVSLLVTHPTYFFIILLSAIPMILSEFVVVNRNWKLQMELLPHHKERHVTERAYYSETAFTQSIMFGQFGFLRKKIAESHNYIVDRYNQLRWSNFTLTSITLVISVTGLCHVLIHSVYWTLNATVQGAGDIGALTILLASAQRLHSSLADIAGQVASQWLSARGVVMVEEEYFGLKPMLVTENPVRPMFLRPPLIEVKNVSFNYPDKTELVLKKVNFSIEPFSKVAILGQNGSGKSSLISLLLRHRDPTSGEIVAGNIPLSSMESSVWNETISALTQSYTVLNRRVGDEIASSRLNESVDMEDVAAAARFAQFHTVIEKDPQGYNSQIGLDMGGREFSGGENQRLALARVVYRHAKILILDEPDAKLDAIAAKEIFENFYNSKHQTLILVTQHIKRAEKCDKIIMLKDGEVAGIGTHEELMRNCEAYAELRSKAEARS